MSDWRSEKTLNKEVFSARFDGKTSSRPDWRQLSVARRLWTMYTIKRPHRMARSASVSFQFDWGASCHKSKTNWQYYQKFYTDILLLVLRSGIALQLINIWKWIFHSFFIIFRRDFNGKYCKANLGIPPTKEKAAVDACSLGGAVDAKGCVSVADTLFIQYGICAPSTCSAEELTALVRKCKPYL